MCNAIKTGQITANNKLEEEILHRNWKLIQNESAEKRSTGIMRI